MKYIRLLFYILFISKTIVTWGGENIGGLSFRAYEYSKDERTSFIIPSGNQGVRFKDYLSVSFDLKIREKGEHFGYVCRMIVDNRNSLNLILVNPVNEEPYLCLIKDQQYLGKIHSSATIDIHEWNRIKIEFLLIPCFASQFPYPACRAPTKRRSGLGSATSRCRAW